MKENLIRKTKWFLPWQDHKEEVWLEEMSKQGLHFIYYFDDCQRFDPGGRRLAMVVRALPEWFDSLVLPFCPGFYRRFLFRN